MALYLKNTVCWKFLSSMDMFVVLYFHVLVILNFYFIFGERSFLDKKSSPLPNTWFRILVCSKRVSIITICFAAVDSRSRARLFSVAASAIRSDTYYLKRTQPDMKGRKYTLCI